MDAILNSTLVELVLALATITSATGILFLTQFFSKRFQFGCEIQKLLHTNDQVFRISLDEKTQRILWDIHYFIKSNGLLNQESQYPVGLRSVIADFS